MIKKMLVLAMMLVMVQGVLAFNGGTYSQSNRAVVSNSIGTNIGQSSSLYGGYGGWGYGWGWPASVSSSNYAGVYGSIGTNINQGTGFYSPYWW